MKWAVMTEKHSSKNTTSQKNPWNNKDEEGNISHIYWDCKVELMQSALGDDFYNLLLSAMKETWEAEYATPGIPYKKANFILDENPRVQFLPNTTRFIDSRDLSKSSLLKTKPAVFNDEMCGILAHRQYYYFDLRELQKIYYINVSTRQISGLCYQPTTKTFVGLEKYREHGNRKFRQVPLETDWVHQNFDKVVVQAAKQKAASDRNRYVKVPVGIGRPTESSKDIRNNPPIAYPQYGEDTCVFSSLSSALHYLEYQDIALQIDDLKKTLMKEKYATIFENLMGQVHAFLHDKSYPYFRKACVISKLTNCENFDLLVEASKKPKNLYHVVLRSEDGAENHAICVVNNFIFDGNYTNAKKLSLESLNTSCGDSPFDGVASGYKFIFD